MNKYLEGYLSSIPPSEYENIIDFLQKYAESNLGISEEEFQSILDNLIKSQKPLTDSSEVYKDERPKDTYNRFFSKASIDLVYLFKIIDSLYDAIESYTYLSSSYFSDIKSELDKLQSKIKEFQTRESYSQNTIIVTEDFKTTESFEDFNDSTSYLFTDRDGIGLKPVNIVHNNTDDMITLAVSNYKDLIHNENGKTTAKIEVLDYRGVPDDSYALSRYAIDSSDTTYWDLTTNSKKPINIPMDTLEPGGAYNKFKLKLPSINRISEISITPFGSYPVEISSIQIEGEDVIKQIDEPVNSSTETMTFNFNPITSDEIVIVIRQKNYVYDILNKNQKEAEAKRLWDIATNGEIESVYDKYKIDYPEEEIYKEYMESKDKEIEIWNENFMREV